MPTPVQFVRGLWAYLWRFQRVPEVRALPDFIPGNRTRLLVNGNEILGAMLEAIRGAKTSIRVQAMYVRLDESMAILIDALEAAAQRGVRVQISIDYGYSIRGPINQRLTAEAATENKQAFQRLFERLRTAGISFIDNRPCNLVISRYLPAELESIRRSLAQRLILDVNHYDHRKVLIVDRQRAIVGSTNLARYYLYQLPPDADQDMEREAHNRAQQGLPEAWGKWHDAAVEITGPSVETLVTVYETQWALMGGPILEDDPPGPVESTGETPVQTLWQRPDHGEISAAYTQLLERAQKSITVINPYITNTTAIRALIRARKRGVRVQIVYPDVHNDTAITRALFERHLPAVLRAGIEVYAYPLRMIHAKLYNIDERWTLIGSFNLNYRSFYHDFELDVCIDSPAFAADVRTRLTEPFIARSRHLTQADGHRTFNVWQWLYQPFT